MAVPQDSDKQKVVTPPEVFYGKITSIYEHASECIVHVLKKEHFELWQNAIKSLKETLPFSHGPTSLYEIPQIGFFFLYRNTDKKYYRAIRLSKTTPGNSLRIFFIDTGEIVEKAFSKNIFFEIPKKLLSIPINRIICRIEKFPLVDSNKGVLGFVNESIKAEHMLKFKIKRPKEIFICDVIEAEWEEECYTVDVAYENEAHWLEDRKGSDEVSSVIEIFRQPDLAPKLTYDEFPKMIKDIEMKSFIPPKGTKVCVYPVSFIKSNLIFGNVRWVDRLWKYKLPSDVIMSTKIKSEMNDKKLKFEKITRLPIKDEIVIAPRLKGIKLMYYRACVLNVGENGICELFYIDTGYHEKVQCEKLYKLPVEFSKIPFVNYRIKFSNIPNYTDDERKEARALKIVKEEIDRYSIGVVEEADNLDMRVQIFSRFGNKIQYLLKDI